MGARKPSDAGFYFQWGDTKGYTANQVGIGDGKKKFADDWSDYKWGADPNFTKYTFKSTLDLEDDAAHVNWGGDWHMPTPDQIKELSTNTTSAWTESDGVSGMKFTSKKDGSKSIFIPAAGFAWDGSVQDSGDYGYVWSSVLGTDDAYLGQVLNFNSGVVYLGSSSRRCNGLSVRGIIEANGNTNGHSYVDLELPSGTLWATMNVGASKPSDEGLYFQWGDTKGYTKDQVGNGNGKKKFASNWSDYKWYNGGKFTKYTTKGATLDLEEDDAANKYLGGNWHIPTFEQFEELLFFVDYKFTTLDGVGGVTVTSKKDSSKSIFIPAAGYALNGSIIKSGEDIAIWMNSLYSNDEGVCVYVGTSGNTIPELLRYYGLPIRGVIG